MSNKERRLNLNQGEGCNFLAPLVEAVRIKKEQFKKKKQLKWPKERGVEFRFNSELDRHFKKMDENQNLL